MKKKKSVPIVTRSGNIVDCSFKGEDAKRVGNRQSVVNAQVSVNRAVFELNRPGIPKEHPAHKSEADPKYLLMCVRAAIKDLQEYEKSATERECPQCGSTSISMFTSDDDTCNKCGRILPGI